MDIFILTALSAPDRYAVEGDGHGVRRTALLAWLHVVQVLYRMMPPAGVVIPAPTGGTPGRHVHGATIFCGASVDEVSFKTPCSVDVPPPSGASPGSGGPRAACSRNKTTGVETREPARPTGGVVKGAPTPELEARITGDATKGTESREPVFTNKYPPLFFNLKTKGSVSEVVTCGGSVPNYVGGFRCRGSCYMLPHALLRLRVRGRWYWGVFCVGLSRRGIDLF